MPGRRPASAALRSASPVLPALRLALLSLAALTLLAACDSASGPDEAREPPRVLTTQEQALTEAAGPHFGLKLFRTVSSEAGTGQNVFLSPLSVSMALGMTLGGAADSTRAAMQKTLALQGLSQAEINQSYRSLIDLLAGLDPSVRFRLANSIWHRNTFSVEQPFIDTNRKYFDAEIAALNFGSGEAAGRINDWVSEATEGKIETMVQPLLPPSVMMYLINAIYFKGDWTYQFDEEKTEEAPFALPGGSEKPVDMMHQTEPTFAYYRGEALEAVDLPYGDSLYTMTVLVPRREASAHALAAALGAERWRAVTRGLRQGEERAGVVLPRFTLEWEKSLKSVLTSMGMGVAFDPSRANFSGINEDLGEGLYISEVKHKSFVKVDEKGTEAAAATSVAIALDSAGPPVVRADRPFLFVIRENHSGTILFIGKVADPSAS